MITRRRRAVGYAAEALRLLRKHPSLLLVAIAMGVLNTADGRVGGYVAYAHTGWGSDMRELLVRGEAVRGKRRKTRAAFSANPFERLLLVAPPTPSVSFVGTGEVLWALTYGKPGKLTAPEPRHPYGRWKGLAGLHEALSLLMMFLLPMIVGGFTSAGYLAAARNTVVEGTPCWRIFVSEGRRCCLRFALLVLLPVIVFAPLGVAATLRPAIAGLVYAPLPVIFLLALAQYAIIADDIGVVASIKRSVITVIRDLPAALVLIVTAGLLGWATHLLDPWSHGGLKLTVNPFPLLPRAILSASLAGVVGAWFSLVAFLWYLDATGRDTGSDGIGPEGV